MWYMVCLAALVICFGVYTPDYITMGEGLVMFSLYIFYVILCMYSETLRLKFATCFTVFATDKDADDNDAIEMDDISKEHKLADQKKSRKYVKSSSSCHPAECGANCPPHPAPHEGSNLHNYAGMRVPP